MSERDLRYGAVGRTVKVLQEGGMRSLWFTLLSEIGYRRLLLLERLLEGPVPEIKLSLPITIDLLKKAEAEEYLKFRVETESSEVTRQLNAGHWCFVARHEGQVISSSCAAAYRAWNFYLACEIPLMPDEVYVYDSFTRPDFRGKSVSAAIRAEMIRYFRAIGFRRIILGTLPENKSNLRTLGKVDFRPFGMIGYIKIGPWRRDFCRINKRIKMYQELDEWCTDQGLISLAKA